MGLKHLDRKKYSVPASQKLKHKVMLQILIYQLYNYKNFTI